MEECMWLCKKKKKKSNSNKWHAPSKQDSCSERINFFPNYVTRRKKIHASSVTKTLNRQICIIYDRELNVLQQLAEMAVRLVTHGSFLESQTGEFSLGQAGFQEAFIYVSNYVPNMNLFWPVFPFYIPWKHQKIKGFLVFSGGGGVENSNIGQKWVNGLPQQILTKIIVSTRFEVALPFLADVTVYNKCCSCNDLFLQEIIAIPEHLKKRTMF